MSFSGLMGGYGWLIIIDHPQANLYSLYGHLSPSRWRITSGDVEKGQLIAYLGDPDENGGSVEEPLEPHLHFGVRAGQKVDYSSRGEWRFQAGWIKLCPQDLGWLQPSAIIIAQNIPPGGYPQPAMGFLVRWGMEILLTAIYTILGIGMILGMVKKKSRAFLTIPGFLVIAAGIVFHMKSMVSTDTLLIMGILLLGCGIYLSFRQVGQKETIEPNH